MKQPAEKKIARLAIVSDDFGDTEQDAQIVDILNYSRIPVDLRISTFSVTEIESHAPDIVVIDYGGMSITGAWDICLSQVRAAVEWAENHPSCAMVIWTQFTSYLYQELQEEFPNLLNIFVNADDTSPMDAIRAYLQATDKID